MCVCFLLLSGSINEEGANHRVIVTECRYHIPKDLSSLQTKCVSKRGRNKIIAKWQRCFFVLFVVTAGILFPKYIFLCEENC